MTYIDSAAKIVAEECGYESGDHPLVHLYTLLTLAKGGNTTLKDVHDAWSIHELEHGDSDHRSVVPFDHLAADTKQLDRPFQEAIRRAAWRIVNEL